MTIQEFTEQMYLAFDEGREKDTMLLAFEYPELYVKYAVAEGLVDEEEEPGWDLYGWDGPDENA